ncbi:MAG TPA: aspartate--tRNA ligase [Acidobacteriota bacterium]|jgi:aspartyl-tRNA synthetase|nr:aspartate--tRNA ligase [Acidobacteriota bacterium]MDP6687154.1 aspartate--tRNA ligase [Acidobacteriota bacterium]MEC7900520.1 aspartate--tRNA ligase [Acidobacteriota bacterium]HJO30548.1 aspartate--tRNA ligase [Acidobacteriota bacterium]|tara:strand:- start:13457 stop:15232 length:1776 start_codon:yes stop_codon:yes gene_type:complete
MDRTHTCGELRAEHAGEKVCLQGWVWHRRDLGGLIFVDLRDRSGSVQLVFNPEEAAEAHVIAEEWRAEWVVLIEGEVAERPPETINEALPTGVVEVRVTRADTVAIAETPPFLIEEDSGALEDLRLKYRYLDLRRSPLQRVLRLRHKMSIAVRNYLDEQGFYEIETPILTRATPEGARDYLVPSRVNPGSFYALPQSPQLFKQLLMISGFDRYFQMARCFRDEDLRANRQPEFTQIDIEMSFVEPDDVLRVTEGMMRCLLEVAGLPADPEFPRMTFRAALDRFGSDAPDTRYGHELQDVTDIVRGCEFRAFSSVAESGGAVKALCWPGGGTAGRGRLDKLVELAKSQRAQGLVWVQHNEDGFKSPVAKFLGDEILSVLCEVTDTGQGDALLMVGDDWEIACLTLGAIRKKLAGWESWIPDDGSFNFCWILEFPLLEKSEEEGRMVARHHPFTSPHIDDLEMLESDAGAVRSLSYDLVLNGMELGGGSIRNSKDDIQRRVFTALGMAPEEAQSQFGFLLDAFKYGAPPHGGIAMGYDRIVMLLSGEKSLRSVTAFPKTASATDLMTAAPAAVDEEQLDALHIALDLPDGSGD